MKLQHEKHQTGKTSVGRRWKHHGLWNTGKKITSGHSETQVQKKESSVETSAVTPNPLFWEWQDSEPGAVSAILMHGHEFWNTALTHAYTANPLYIKDFQWLRKETQQHTQVKMDLFARRVEVVPLQACRDVCMRTAESRKALITSCFPFTPNEALSRVSLLLSKFLLNVAVGWCNLFGAENISLSKRQAHFSMVHLKSE